jgi:hypothetical protein
LGCAFNRAQPCKEMNLNTFRPYENYTGRYVPITTTISVPLTCPNDEWEEEIIIIKRRKRKTGPMEPDITPLVPMEPLPQVPWKYNPRPDECHPTIIWGKEEPCAIREFFKRNPNGTCMMVCYCRSCRATC